MSTHDFITISKIILFLLVAKFIIAFIMYFLFKEYDEYNNDDIRFRYDNSLIGRIANLFFGMPIWMENIIRYIENKNRR